MSITEPTTAVVAPILATVAYEGVALAHVPPGAPVVVNVDVVPLQTYTLPDIVPALGSPIILITLVATHPLNE